MFANDTHRQSIPVRVRRRRHSGSETQSIEEAYEARLLGEVARWDDQAAFESIYARHIGAVTGAALSICRDSEIAADIAQQTFAALWIRAARLTAKSLRLRPWLCTVARNAAIEYVRTGADAPMSIDRAKQTPAQESGPDQSALAAETLSELHDVLGMLPPEQRLAVDMVYFAGMTYAAAAGATGEPVGTIKSRVHRALAFLRARMVQ